MNIEPLKRTLFTGGPIYLHGTSTSRVEALLVEGDRVTFAGNIQEVDNIAFGEKVDSVDLNGHIVLPGFIDAHIHLEKFGLQLDYVDCEVESREECLQRIRDRIEQSVEGEWILGHGWNQNRWDRYGSAADLDALSTGHPIYLTAKSLHAGWANTKAMEEAEIFKKVNDIPPEWIQRDHEGQPTGIFFEGAMSLLQSVVGKPDPAALIKALESAQKELLDLGITGVHDFDGPSCLRSLQTMEANGNLMLKVVKNLPGSMPELAIGLGLKTGFGQSTLRIGHIKLFADGALGPRTASMLEPYDGDENHSGLLLLSEDQLLNRIGDAVTSGLWASIHAIGDRANRVVLNVLQKIRDLEVERGLPPGRHRVEHVQLLHPRDLHRFAELQVIASMQPIHATSDREMAETHWGERSRYAYAWGTLAATGATIVFGSDAPVEPPNPFWGIHAAVNREPPDRETDRGPWIPEECLSVEQAVSAYLNPTSSVLGDQRVGNLQPGSYADLQILGMDPFHCDPSRLKGISPLGVMVSGSWHKRSF